MASLKDLLRYKKEVKITSPDNADKVIATAWIRTVGDEDLRESFRLARIASSDARSKLRNEGTVEYKDELEPLSEMTRGEQETVIVEANRTKFLNESWVHINREDLPTIDEIAVEPDAPTLEEQEKLDAKILEQEIEYQKKLREFVDSKIEELTAKVKGYSDEELLAQTRTEIANILPLRMFFTELALQKLLRGVYKDKECKIREFTTIEEVRETNDHIKELLIKAYDALEVGPDDIKNS